MNDGDAKVAAPADGSTGNDAQSRVPTISLPKGGGAVRGIGEKFGIDPATGTGSMTIPIAVSPGRTGFGPQLTLAYDSGHGNGPFGLGWRLSLPSITRKTDKGLPLYRDSVESDVYILSGAEDLVPLPPSDSPDPAFVVRRYRPRIEGAYARVERWTERSNGDIHWRSITRDNVTTLYGRTETSRIVDPADPARIFSWLICQSFDDKGNAIVYDYTAEDSAGLQIDPINERNRTKASRSSALYVKRIRYGNRAPNRDLATWRPSDAATLPDDTWMFEVVFDYGEGHLVVAAPPDPDGRQFVVASDTPPPNATASPGRLDAFSTYRPGFEVRTYRLCRRIMMFHRFPDELGIDACLVSSSEVEYAENPVASHLAAFRHCGYVRQPIAQSQARYLQRSLPPLEFDYSQAPSPDALTQAPLRTIAPESLENLPEGLDGRRYQWLDLDGEGLAGVLSEQSDGWYYKRNRSANNTVSEGGSSYLLARFARLERIRAKPAASIHGDMRLQDLDGDGQLDLVRLEGAVRGFHERTEDGAWGVFRAFARCPDVSDRDQNLRFVDLTGDGHADLLLTLGNVLRWSPSLAEGGFAAPFTVDLPSDDERGPRLVFADGQGAIYLADMSGDGLDDLVRVRNGNVCYWPNLGYGQFGAKVAMDNAPWFDEPDRFDQRRIRLADIDGSGAVDIVYLRHDGARVYLNQSGNAWSTAATLAQFPAAGDPVNLQVLDLLGTGTACLVDSTPAPAAQRRSIRYISLMDEKPHLLKVVRNNLGAETHIAYVPSTKFYLDDLEAGAPWVTRLPFPVHTVEQVDTFDRIAGNQLTTRYAYHHGFFDGVEREFRGFGMIEQWDTEFVPALGGAAGASASSIPPVHTRTWFHTGAYHSLDQLSAVFTGLASYGGGKESYFRPSGLTDTQFLAQLLPDAILPAGMSADETREAHRALKGAVLRQEIYGLDNSDKSGIPYSAVQHSYAVAMLQPQGANRHAVFQVKPSESLTCHYERAEDDPRVQHTLNLEVDAFGLVRKSASIAYGRSQPDTSLPADDQATQARALLTYSEHDPTNVIDLVDDYRAPLIARSVDFELTGYAPSGPAGRFRAADFVAAGGGGALALLFDSELAYEAAPTGGRQRRPIEETRTLFRKDDLTALLPLGEIESCAIVGESYRLALTAGLIDGVFVRDGVALLPNVAGVLTAAGADGGGFVDLEGDGRFWVASGLTFFSPGASDNTAAELSEARQHFFLPRRYRDPFHSPAASTESLVTYAHDLLVLETQDPLGNRVTAGVRTKIDDSLDPTQPGLDYRVLQPSLISDPNRNGRAVAFDALGLVVATAVMGKLEEALGDNLSGFDPDPTDAALHTQLDNPLTDPAAMLGQATTRFVYDLAAYQNTQGQAMPRPPVAHLLARETHVSDENGVPSKLQMSFSYSDGFGREIQTKHLAPAGPTPLRDANGDIVLGPDNQPILTPQDINPRWIGSGWTIFSRGKPVRQFEPFFSDTHLYDKDVRIGVSKVVLQDPVGRSVAILHPNHTFEKTMFGAWRQETWDVNDTVLIGVPTTDTDVSGFFDLLSHADYSPSWYDQRSTGSLGAAEQDAAVKAAVHAATPVVSHADPLGRTFLTIAHNRAAYTDAPAGSPPVDDFLTTCTILDIEGNQRAVIDPLGRTVMRYDCDVLGRRIHQASMEAGERWSLNDAAAKPLLGWDSRGHALRTSYDALRRPTAVFLSPGGDVAEAMVERLDYGESVAKPEDANLRGKLVAHRDQAGFARSDVFDFKGNMLASSRQVATVFDALIDWSGANDLEPDVHASSSRYDALNRLIEVTTPDASVTRYGFDAAGKLTSVTAALQGGAAWTTFVSAIAYDAKGQRTAISYGNGVSTAYVRDGLTYRLTNLTTTRPVAAFPGDTPKPPLDGWPGAGVQNLSFAYDPAGNITAIRDDAQQTVFFANRRVEPSCAYLYDAVYRLIEATGREHLGQAGGPPIPHSYNDAPRVGLPAPGDGMAMQTYLERYRYDAVGNFVEMRHVGQGVGQPTWARAYAYAEASQLEPAKPSNRLSNTTLSGVVDAYGYDAHGNMLGMSHLQEMQWDFRDQLQMTRRQAVNGADTDGLAHQGERTWYVYDGAGQRVRKVTESVPGQVKDERIYLGGFEIYRRYGADPLSRETLHVMDDKQRVALVETLTAGNDGSPAQLVRYQHGNHLGSATLELDGQANITSYEEYSPYGSTVYQAVASNLGTPKRYRFSAAERDEENGFGYHGARYYASWLGSWTSCDSVFTASHSSLYLYSLARPTSLIDPDGTDPTPPWLSRTDFTIAVEGAGEYSDPAEAMAAAGDVAARRTPKLPGERKASPALQYHPNEYYENRLPNPLKVLANWPATALARVMLASTEPPAGVSKDIQDYRIFRYKTATEEVLGDAAEQMLDILAPIAGEAAAVKIAPALETGAPLVSKLATRVEAAVANASEGLATAAAPGARVTINGVQATELGGRLSTAQMASLQAEHGTEFAQIYLTGPGRNGGGGTYYLLQGSKGAVDIPIGPNVRFISHSHPEMLNGGVVPLTASDPDRAVLRLLQESGSPQKISQVVPESAAPFNYTKDTYRVR